MTAAEPLNSRYKYMTATAVAQGQWLRRMRQAHGWSIGQMVDRLREAVSAAGGEPPARESLVTMIRRWEDGLSGVSERYRLRYCAAFNLPVDRFGDPSVLHPAHANGMSQCGAGHAGQVQLRSAWDSMQLALGQIADPARRGQLCFVLGYLCAQMIMDGPATVSAVTSVPAPAGDRDQTC